MTSPATYRCTACGREFGATSPAVVFGVHGVGPRSRLTCTSGSLVPVGPVTIPIARDDRDDRAGVTLPTAVEPVGGDQRRSELDSRLGGALRASGINATDALAVQVLYATAGQSGSHRIVSALRAIEAWLREGGAL